MKKKQLLVFTWNYKISFHVLKTKTIIEQGFELITSNIKNIYGRHPNVLTKYHYIYFMRFKYQYDIKKIVDSSKTRVNATFHFNWWMR